MHWTLDIHRQPGEHPYHRAAPFCAPGIVHPAEAKLDRSGTVRSGAVATGFGSALRRSTRGDTGVGFHCNELWIRRSGLDVLACSTSRRRRLACLRQGHRPSRQQGVLAQPASRLPPRSRHRRGLHRFRRRKPQTPGRPRPPHALALYPGLRLSRPWSLPAKGFTRLSSRQ